LSTFLVFGASGPVGRAVLARLRDVAARVYAVSRAAPDAATGPGAQWIHGDLHADLAAPAEPVDVILSLGPLDAFAGWFEREAPRGVRRVVALGSMSAESKRGSADPAERELAARLIAAEQQLARAAAARAIAWTVLRPTLIYGDGRDRSLAPILRFMRRWRVAPIPFGAHGLRQPVHVADVAAAVLAAVDSAAAANRIYPLGGGERLRFDTLLRRLRDAVPGFVLPVPVPLGVLGVAARLGASVFGPAAIARLREPLVADNSAAARDLGYAPRAFTAADVLPVRAPY
jgi:nucleoside-diphosphate-sugar epimerase